MLFSPGLLSAADSNFSVMIFHILQQSSLELGKCTHLGLYKNYRVQLVSAYVLSSYLKAKYFPSMIKEKTKDIDSYYLYSVLHWMF